MWKYKLLSSPMHNFIQHPNYLLFLKSQATHHYVFEYRQSIGLFPNHRDRRLNTTTDKTVPTILMHPKTPDGSDTEVPVLVWPVLWRLRQPFVWKQQHKDEKRVHSICGIILTGKNPSTRRKTCLSAVLFNANLTWTKPASNPEFHGQKSATKHL